MGRHRATLARLIPELAGPTPEAASSGAEAAEREQFLLFDAVASLLRGVADDHPLILVLDDCTGLTPQRCCCYGMSCALPSAHRLLILGTYRETEVDQAHPLARALAELRRARALESVALAGSARRMSRS